MSSPIERPPLPWLRLSCGFEQFVELAKERYRVKLRRERREPSPWTDDPVMQAYRFCNVHREDDKVTTWFRENVRDHLAESPGHDIVATAGFRWFNNIPAGERLLPMLKGGAWDSDFVRAQLCDLSPLVTGAYMIKTPTGKNKLEGIIQCMEDLVKSDVIPRMISGERDRGLQEMHSILMEAPFLGPFMAYEIISDIRWTTTGRRAPDIMTWANPGPGAARGIGWVEYGDPETFNRNNTDDLDYMTGVAMPKLLGYAQKNWPERWRPWEMREVEHWLCEYAKWCSATYHKKPQKRNFP